MGKKSRRNRQRQRHNEPVTVRYKRVSYNVPTDREGNPIPFNRRKLAELMEESGLTTAPDAFNRVEPELPNNVTCIKHEREKRQSTPNKGKQQLEQVSDVYQDRSYKPNIPDIIANEVALYQKWSSERQSAEWVNKHVSKAEREAWSHQWKVRVIAKQKNGREQADIKANERRSAIDSPPSLVHNPGLSVKPVKFYCGYTGNAPDVRQVLSPSGRPIKDFEPEKWGLKTHLPDVVHSTIAANEDVFVRKTPDKQSFNYKTHSMLQYFIANVEVQNWPTAVYNFVRWTSDGPIINTGAVNQALADPAQEMMLVKDMFTGLERDFKLVSDALSDSTQENNLLHQELKAEKQHNNLISYDLAHRTGDSETVDEIERELYGTQYAQPPVNFESVIKEYNLFRSLTQSKGMAFAYGRMMYGGVYGEELDSQVKADHKLRERIRWEKNRLRLIKLRVARRIRNAGYVKYPEIKKFREKLALYRIKNKVKSGCTMDYSQYRSRLHVSREVAAVRSWGKTSQPGVSAKVDYRKVINRVCNVYSVNYSSPRLVEFYNQLTDENGMPVQHQKYRSTASALYYKPQSASGKLAVKTKGVYNSFVGLLNMELNPFTIRREMEAESERERVSKQLRYERKLRKDARKKAKADGDKRVMQAKNTLVHRGFVIVEK